MNGPRIVSPSFNVPFIKPQIEFETGSNIKFNTIVQIISFSFLNIVSDKEL